MPAAMVQSVILTQQEIALLIQVIGLARVPGAEFSGEEQLMLMSLSRKLERHQQMERVPVLETKP